MLRLLQMTSEQYQDEADAAAAGEDEGHLRVYLPDSRGGGEAAEAAAADHVESGDGSGHLVRDCWPACQAGTRVSLMLLGPGLVVKVQFGPLDRGGEWRDLHPDGALPFGDAGGGMPLTHQGPDGGAEGAAPAPASASASASGEADPPDAPSPPPPLLPPLFLVIMLQARRGRQVP